MGVSFQELPPTVVATSPTKMKYLVFLSLLLVSMANTQEEVDQPTIDGLNAVLPSGFTRICDVGETPPGGESRGKRQIGQGPPPCWSIVDESFSRSNCAAQFENTCSKSKPYVLKGQTAMCIQFPAAGNKWFVLKGTYGWCGVDECCDFHLKKSDQCNPIRPFLEFFPLPSSYSSCAQVPNASELSVSGAELMKGTEGSERIVCIKDTESGQWTDITATLSDCGGFGCCRFELPQDQ